MTVCPRCKGSGSIREGRPYMVQLREFGKWHDYLDYNTQEEAVSCADATRWGNRSRVMFQRQVVWRGREGKP